MLFDVFLYFLPKVFTEQQRKTTSTQACLPSWSLGTSTFWRDKYIATYTSQTALYLLQDWNLKNNTPTACFIAFPCTSCRKEADPWFSLNTNVQAQNLSSTIHWKESFQDREVSNICYKKYTKDINYLIHRLFTIILRCVFAFFLFGY